MERKRRLALCFLSACLALTLYFAGREAFLGTPTIAVIQPAGGVDVVRVAGCVTDPGIYRIPKSTKMVAVIKMTAPFVIGKLADQSILNREVRGGEIVTVTPRGEQLFEISMERMKAKERMLLGIPLEPDQMDLADWDSLPGIGPALAKTIMEDRQYNGDFGCVESLQRVPGIGEKRFKELKKYF
ncbi:MAG TPA: helix-hairpin-helix domain-containing protein [Geobacteraceae bacterium]|nr:helix-hairpin-helix domain-containing protein [Geobacteraceae bacterium]